MNSKPFRLVLTAEQTAAIRESGIGFVAGSPVSLQNTTGPATLLLFECDQEAANGACDVAMGLAKARPIATRHNPSSKQPEPSPAGDQLPTPGMG